MTAGPMPSWGRVAQTLQGDGARAPVLMIREGGLTMLYYALLFLVLAIVAGVLGFGGIAGAASWIAKVLFLVFLVALVISVIANATKGRRPL